MRKICGAGGGVGGCRAAGGAGGGGYRRQNRADQQLHRLCRRCRRPGAERHHPVRQAARQGSAAGRQDRSWCARDDTSTPEVGKRLAQELITRDHVQLLDPASCWSPVAAAVALLTKEAKVPLLPAGEAAAGAAITRHSRRVLLALAAASFTLWHTGPTRWANGPAEQGWKNGLYGGHRLYSPATILEAAFTKSFTEAGGKINRRRCAICRSGTWISPPFVQRIKDAKP